MTFSAAFYMLIAGCPAVSGIPLLAVASLTAWARVYSGIHFPFDMAGSLVVGLASAALMRRIAGRLNPLQVKLVQFVDPLTDRIVRANSQGERKR